MMSAAEYLEGRVFEARRPRRELQPVVAYADAVEALGQALADAEKYKYLLMRALRRHADETVGSAAVPSRPSLIPEPMPVLPLYPLQGRMAA